MNLNWILSPIALFGALATALMACLALFVTTKIEIAKLNRQHARARQAEATDVGALAEEVQRLNEAFHTLDRTPAPALGINFTRRTQVIKMHSRGETVETIAAALQITASEIDLTLKLHSMLKIR